MTEVRHGYARDREGATNAAPLVPPSSARELAGFRIAAERRGPDGARTGDFYTVTVRGPGRIGILIGDACGSGSVGAAQLAAVLPKVRELAIATVSPAALLTELNRAAVNGLPLDRFVTALALELDEPRGSLTVANAGHVPLLVRRRSSVTMVSGSVGAPLGFSETSRYSNERHDLERGDVIVLMTDGILEAIEVDMLSMTHTRSLFETAALGARGAHLQFLREFEECTAGRLTDDMTLMAVEAVSGVRASNGNGLLQVG